MTRMTRWTTTLTLAAALALTALALAAAPAAAQSTAPGACPAIGDPGIIPAGTCASAFATVNPHTGGNFLVPYTPSGISDGFLFSTFRIIDANGDGQLCIYTSL